MKQIFNNIRQRLEQTNAFKHIDKDWGQLSREQPPVSFPCALIDCDSMALSQKGNRVVSVSADITVTVANMRMSNTGDTFGVFDLITDVHDALHSWSPDPRCGRFLYADMAKLSADYGFEVYKLTFRTSFDIAMPDHSLSARLQPVVIKHNRLK